MPENHNLILLLLLNCIAFYGLNYVHPEYLSDNPTEGKEH